MRKHLPALGVLLTAALGAAAPAQAQVPAQIVDALNKIYGAHPGFRANHAKGVVVEGSFKPTAQAGELSRAILFSGASIPVVVRFSDSGGLPTVADGDPHANPHGMAIKFLLPNGRKTDMVINSLKFFPVATGEEFRDLLLAIADSPPNAAKPTKLEQFLATHPAVPKALATIATPDSFADEAYYGVDAFVLVDKSGRRRAVRYIAQPEKLVHLDAADAAARAPDFLVQELPARIAQGPVVFHLKAQLAAAGDPTKDPTQAWPEDREVVELGTLTLDKRVADSAAEEKKLLFLPAALTDGIEPSDDPLIGVRSAAYAISFGRRSQ